MPPAHNVRRPKVHVVGCHVVWVCLASGFLAHRLAQEIVPVQQCYLQIALQVVVRHRVAVVAAPVRLEGVQVGPVGFLCSVVVVFVVLLLVVGGLLLGLPLSRLHWWLNVWMMMMMSNFGLGILVELVRKEFD